MGIYGEVSYLSKFIQSICFLPGIRVEKWIHLFLVVLALIRCLKITDYMIAQYNCTVHKNDNILLFFISANLEKKMDTVGVCKHQ